MSPKLNDILDLSFQRRGIKTVEIESTSETARKTDRHTSRGHR